MTDVFGPVARHRRPLRYTASVTLPSFSAPPLVLRRCAIVEYAATSELTFTEGDADDVGRVAFLAIGENLHEDEVVLFHCDTRWNVLGSSSHASVAEARGRAERTYAGVGHAWVERPVSKSEAVAYLDAKAHGEECSFCGRRPDEVGQIVERGSARICDACIRECHALLTGSSPREN